MLETLLPSLPLIPLYAEIHYRFRYFPLSLYFRRAPEIIFDCPWRIAPDYPPTIFLLLKDAHRWPVKLESVSINWETDRGDSGVTFFPFEETEISTPWFYQAFTLDQDRFRRPAHLSLVPTLQFILRGRKKSVTLDNFRCLPKRPLQTFLARENFPVLPGWRVGDIHVHTHLTSDQVEFGAPLRMTQHGADVLGLDFVSATDHSYDLDDLPGNYLQNDPRLTKWYTSRQEMVDLNASHAQSSSLLPGEEVTVRNGNQHNVHLLHINDAQFFPGSGDGAEHWLRTRSELTLSQVLENRSRQTVSIVAHLKYKVPFLHRLLIDRDEWQFNDLSVAGLDGAQVLSGTPASRDFFRSRKLWIQALLQGRRLAIYGGSDAHGNFNIFRQVKMPMLKLFRLNDQILGQARTLVYAAGNQPETLIAAMQHRRTAVTTGPVGDLFITTPTGDRHGMGEDVEISTNGVSIQLDGLSSPEFGPVTSIILYQGNLTTRQETIIWEKRPATRTFHLSHTINLKLFDPAYFRLEIITPGNHRWPGVYLSSPIWVKHLER